MDLKWSAVRKVGGTPAAAMALRRGRVDLVRRTPVQTEVEIRSLAAYDTALGIAIGAEGRLG
jgi:hypothetical protein